MVHGDCNYKWYMGTAIRNGSWVQDGDAIIMECNDKWYLQSEVHGK